MSNVIEYPAGRVHKRYAANIPRYAGTQREVAAVKGQDESSYLAPAPIHPGVVMLGLITLWAFWCAGLR